MATKQVVNQSVSVTVNESANDLTFIKKTFSGDSKTDNTSSAPKAIKITEESANVKNAWFFFF